MLQELAQKDIPQWYDEFIATAEDNYQKQLFRAEKLSYVLNAHIWSDCNRSDLANTDDARYLERALPPDFERGLDLINEYIRYRNDVLDRLVVSELSSEMVASFPPSISYEYATLLGRIARRVNMLPESVVYWQVAYHSAMKLKDMRRQINALVGQDESLTEYDPEETLTILDQALQLCGTEESADLQPMVMHAIGYAHRQLFALDKAIEWYLKAYRQAIHFEDKEKTPEIINDMGFVYSLVGDYSTAYLHVNKAWQLLFSQYKQHETHLAVLQQQTETIDKSSKEYRELQAAVIRQEELLLQLALEVGRSFNTLGLVSRYSDTLEQAIADHTEALRYFEFARDNFWRMRALHSRGDVNRRLAKKHYDEGRIHRAQEYDEIAGQDIEASLELCTKFGYTTELDTVNRRMGRLVHDRYFRTNSPDSKRSYLARAYSFFNKALKLAQANNDTVEEMEALTEIAFLADDYVSLAKDFYPDELSEALKQGESYIQMLVDGLDRHKTDSHRIFQFEVFEGLCLIEQAAFAYLQERKDEALELYVAGFIKMAGEPGYGSAQYHAHKHHLFDNIRNLKNPKQERLWCERLIAAWQETIVDPEEGTTLAHIHPDLVDWCQLHKETLFLFG